MGYLAAGFVALLLTQTPSPRPLSESRGGLQPQVLITTLPTAPLTEAAAMTLEHDTEVSSAETVTIIVSIADCQKDEKGACNASADLVVNRPDGRVHTEVKGVSLNQRRATAPLKLTADDPLGLYTVVAIVRDLNARRFGKAERIFGLR